MSGDHDHVNMLAIDHLHDVTDYVISDFNAENRLHSSGYESRPALGQMELCVCSRLLKERGFWNEVWDSRGRELRNHAPSGRLANWPDLVTCS